MLYHPGMGSSTDPLNILLLESYVIKSALLDCLCVLEIRVTQQFALFNQIKFYTLVSNLNRFVSKELIMSKWVSYDDAQWVKILCWKLYSQAHWTIFIVSGRELLLNFCSLPSIFIESTFAVGKKCHISAWLCTNW